MPASCFAGSSIMEAKEAGMDEWEYKILYDPRGAIGTSLEEQLNAAGREGWEAVSISVLDPSAQIIRSQVLMKRRL